MRGRAPPWWPLVALVAIIGLTYLPLLLGEVLFYRDIGRWIYPLLGLLRTAVQHGEFPAWNPTDGIGLSSVASPLHGLFYPPNWLAATAGASLARALSWNGLLHLLAGAVGMMTLGRRLGLSAAASLVAALVWALSGFTTTIWTTDNLIYTVPWYPWCALGFIALARRCGGGMRELVAGVLLAACPLGCMALIGEVFQTALAAVVGVIFALLWRRSQRDTGLVIPARKLAGATAAACVFAVALSACFVLPLGGALQETTRPDGIARERAEKWSLHPLRLIELVAPGAMGDPYGSYPGGALTADGSYDDRSFLYSAYLGAAAVALALVGIRRRPLQPMVLCALAAVSIVLAMGRHTPLHAIFRWLFPVFLYHRTPEKFVGLAVPFLAVAAGFGLDRIRTASPPWRRTLVFTAAIGSLTLAPTLFGPTPLTVFIRMAALHGTVAALAVAAATLVARRFAGPAQFLATLAVAADLALAAIPFLKLAPPEILDRPPAFATAIYADPAWQRLATNPRVFRDDTVEAAIDRRVRRDQLATLERRRIDALRPSTPGVFGIATLPGYVAEPTPLSDRVWKEAKDRPLTLLALLAVDYAVLPVHGERPPQVPGLTHLPVDGPPGAALYRVDSRLPRAYVAAQASIIEEGLALEQLFTPDVIEGRRVLLAPGATPTGAGQGGACKILSFGLTRIEADCDTRGPGYAVFVERYASGWKAFVDGAATELHRANILLRAVALSNGRHQVVLEYHPRGFKAGVAITAASWTLVALFALGYWLSRRSLSGLASSP